MTRLVLFAYKPICLSACLMLCFLFCLSIKAQDLDDVTISGRVIDQNNAVIPGATVKAKLITTGKERSVIADAEGKYRFVELDPGVYELVASFKNFQDTTVKDLTTIAAQNVQLDITLYPQGVNAATTVEADTDASLIDTTRTVVGSTITVREIEDLPVNSRSPLDLIFLLSSVGEEPLSTRNLAEDRNSTPSGNLLEAGNFSLSGGTAYSNNVTIDGLDNNDDRAATERFQPSLEAVEEVQVITNQFSSEYGRASGGRVNLRTRSGSNKYKGRAAFFFRDESLNSNTWRNNQRGLKRLPLTELNPVFTFGGPIIKKRTFFFAAYEVNSLQDTTLIDTLVPIVQNSRFPLPQPTNPNAARLEVISGSLAASIAPYIVPVSTPNRNHIFSGRVDHNFTDTHNATFSIQYGRQDNQRQSSTTGSTRRLEEAFVGNIKNTYAFSAQDNFVFSPSMVNQLRFQYSTLKPDVVAQTEGEPVVLITMNDPLRPGGTTAPTLTAGSSTSNGTSRSENRWQVTDTMTYIRGSHSLKFGGDFQHIRSTFFDLFDTTGTYNFRSAGDFLANTLNRYRHNYQKQSTQENTYLGFFFQDEWRVRENLQLSFGLRYENESILKDRNNFGPRIALTYDPFKTGKTVIRAGGGIFYNRVLLRTIDDFSVETNGVLFDTNQIPTGDRTTVLNAIASGFPNAVPLNSPIFQQFPQYAPQGRATFTSIDPTIRIPESYQVNIGIERELGKGFVFEANYTWNRGVHLWREFNPNAPRLPAGFPDFASYLLSRDFSNAQVNGVRPLYTTNGAGDLVRFMLTPFDSANPQRCPTNANPTNPDLGGCVIINGTRITLVNLNSFSDGLPVDIALAALANLRPNPSLGQQAQLASVGNSYYHGLTLELRRRLARLKSGFSFSVRTSYTLSKLRDDGIVNTSEALVVGDFKRELENSVQDRRHRFVISGTFGMPRMLGKLQFSPIVRVTSGSPFNLSLGGVDRNLDDVNNDRPNFSGDINSIVWHPPGTSTDPNFVAQFTNTTIGTSGNLPRNAGIGPAQFFFDLNITREFRIGERMKLRPVIEFDNILNARVFSFGSEFINFDALSPTTTPADRQAFLDSFLVPTRTARPRQVRVGLRFDF